MADIVEHILHCNICKKVYKHKLNDLKEIKKMIDKEWKEVTS
jgi:hypothetical protein